MKKIEDAVILMAGMGTRFLPATKAVAKELFPVANKPALLFHLKECLDSGIKNVVLVISKQKKDVKKFLLHNEKLEKSIKGTSKEKLLAEWSEVVDKLNIKFVYQGKMNGSAGAVYSARKFVKNRPFVVIFGDDLCVYEGKTLPAIKELMNTYEQTGKYVMSAMECTDDEITRYGAIDIKERFDKTTVSLKGIVEKPKKGTEPSNLASMGRYVVLENIFDNIKKLAKGQTGEILLPYAIAMEIEKDNVVAKTFSAKYYDLGNKLGFVKATVEIALKDKEICDDLVSYLEDLVKKCKKK